VSYFYWRQEKIQVVKPAKEKQDVASQKFSKIQGSIQCVLKTMPVMILLILLFATPMAYYVIVLLVTLSLLVSDHVR
jgi:hypothetical protein